MRLPLTFPAAALLSGAFSEFRPNNVLSLYEISICSFLFLYEISSGRTSEDSSVAIKVA